MLHPIGVYHSSATDDWVVRGQLQNRQRLPRACRPRYRATGMREIFPSFGLKVVNGGAAPSTLTAAVEPRKEASPPEKTSSTRKSKERKDREHVFIPNISSDFEKDRMSVLLLKYVSFSSLKSHQYRSVNGYNHWKLLDSFYRNWIGILRFRFIFQSNSVEENTVWPLF